MDEQSEQLRQRRLERAIALYLRTTANEYGADILVPLGDGLYTRQPRLEASLLCFDATLYTPHGKFNEYRGHIDVIDRFGSIAAEQVHDKMTTYQAQVLRAIAAECLAPRKRHE